MTALERITNRVNRHGEVNDPATPPLLTLAEFFAGNDVVGSIGCNLTPTPTPAEFQETWARIAARPDVADVRVQVTMFDDPEWLSDTVWVITTASAEEVLGWFGEEMRPDECLLGWQDFAVEPCQVPDGMKPVACWWD